MPPTPAAATTRARTTRAGSTRAGSTPARTAPRRRPRRAGGHLLGQPATGVVVTGGASGIGLATCLALAEVGRPVAVWDRDATGARRVARRCTAEHGVAAVAVGLDVTVTADLASAARKTLRALGSVGGLVHAAGIGGAAPVTLVDDEGWDAVLDVNLRAGAMLTRVLHPLLVDAGPGSAIVHISSIEAFVGSAWLPAYCSSKAGLLGLARSSAVALGADGIRVNAICPGAVDTPLLAPLLALPGTRDTLEQRTPLGRLAEPHDIARVARFLLSDQAAYISGTSLVVDGGMLALGGV